MKLTREEVQRTATLARLHLTLDEQEQLTEQLDHILRYMEKLDKLDTSKVEPFIHAVDVINALREDRLTNQPNPEQLLAGAPARDKNFFKVPKIIE